MIELLIIFAVLFALVWLVFKFLLRKKNPFTEMFFWGTLILSSFILIAFLFFWFARSFFGGPPDDGWTRRFHENGSLSSEFFANDGKIEGYSKSFYPNGQLKFLSKFKEGIKVDTSFTYYKTGQISTMEIFENNKSILEINYFSNGLKSSERYNPLDSLKDNYNISYFENGEKDFETRISNRDHEGTGVYYYTNGNEKYRGQFKDGRKNGLWIYVDSLSRDTIDIDTFNYKEDRPFKTQW
jgi:antitoxin component YwqK of YwqJK toxin-antitoxin module